jgi:hypothetical protein
MSQWFFQVRGAVSGPMSLEDLRQRLSDGEIGGETRVREGDGTWLPAAEVEELIELRGARVGVLEDDEGLDEGLAGRDAEEGHEVRRSPLGLRPCADCGRMVSQRAWMCPDCGRYFHDNSFTIPYRAEHPVPVLIFFVLLAVAFVVASPIVVYAVTNLILERLGASGALSPAATIFPALVTILYVVSMISTAALGGAVGKPRGGYYTGLLLGLFFGPLGVFAAYAVDKRAQCPNCFTRLGGLARECPHCRARLNWEFVTSWY